MLLLIISLFTIIATTKRVIPKEYPLFKQCDSRWGSNIMEPPLTICDVGCLMSSTSMALNGHGYKIGSQEADPGTLNTWLRNNNGYTSGSDFKENVLDNLASGIEYIGAVSSMTTQQVEDALNDPHKIIIANVMDGRHFVLAIGWDTSNENIWLVNDPGFSRDSYAKSDVVGWRVFTMV